MTKLVAVSYSVRGVDYSAITTAPVAAMIAADIERRYEGRVAVRLERAS